MKQITEMTLQEMLEEKTRLEDEIILGQKRVTEIRKHLDSYYRIIFRDDAKTVANEG